MDEPITLSLETNPKPHFILFSFWQMHQYVKLFPVVKVKVAQFGTVSVDIGYGGAFYALIPAQALGLNLTESTVKDLEDASTKVKGTYKTVLKIIKSIHTRPY